MTKKICSRCKKRKLLSEFYTAGNGYYAYCKRCVSVMNKNDRTDKKKTKPTYDESQEEIRQAKEYNRTHPFDEEILSNFVKILIDRQSGRERTI